MPVCSFLRRALLQSVSWLPSFRARIVVLTMHHTFVIFHHLLPGQIPCILILLLCNHLLGLVKLVFFNLLLLKHLLLGFEARKKSTEALRLQGSTADGAEVTGSVTFDRSFLLRKGHHTLSFHVLFRGRLHSWSFGVCPLLCCLTGGAGNC